MGAKLDEVSLRSYLEQAALSEDLADRQAFQDQLLRYLFETETYEVWGRSLANHYGRPNEWDEAQQVITEELVRYIRQITPETVRSIDRIAAHLYFKAKTAVVRWLDSPAVTVASEMSGISRRYRQSMVGRSEFIAKYNREPSDRELVEYINTKVSATRKNAAKQGALVTESDVSGRMLQSYSMDHQPADGEGDGFGVPSTDESVRGRGELSLTVRRLAEIAQEQFGHVSEPTVKEVLDAWMEFVLDNEPPTVTSIAKKLGIARPLARERMRQADAVMAALRVDEQFSAQVVAYADAVIAGTPGEDVVDADAHSRIVVILRIVTPRETGDGEDFGQWLDQMIAKVSGSCPELSRDALYALRSLIATLWR